MSLLSTQVQQAEELGALWRQRRSNVLLLWTDARQRQFDQLCDAEIAALLKRHAEAAARLDTALTAAMRLMLSVRPEG